MKAMSVGNFFTVRRAVQLIALLSILAIITVACAPGAPAPEAGKISLSSPAFSDGGEIPVKYSHYEGQNISPPLTWSAGPAGTQSYVLIMDDIDLWKETAKGVYSIHWVLFNIPADTLGLPEDLPKEERLANGAIHGKNRFVENYYGGPRPKVGTVHRYQFTIYALDTFLDLPPGASSEEVLAAIQGHILAQGELIGKYAR